MYKLDLVQSVVTVEVDQEVTLVFADDEGKISFVPEFDENGKLIGFGVRTM